MVKIKISEIKMGNRHRKNLGDLSILAKSIENLGLLQPIGITKEKDLVFGERRIEAVKILGWEEIETKIIDIESLVDGEYAENEVRKDFSISERVAIGTTLEKKLGERRGRTEIEYSTEKVQNSAQLDGNVSISVEYATDSDASKTRDLASEKSGFGSHFTYAEAKKVVKKGIPELVEMMDSGKIAVSDASKITNESPETQKQLVDKVESGEVKTLKQAKRKINIQEQEEKIKNIEVPTGKYDVIVIDPPWNYGSEYSETGRRVASPYPEMSLEEIMAIKIPSEESCILWLWTTNTFMHEAYHLLEKWEFIPKTILTWVKDRIVTGYWLRGKTEHCILATKGTPQIKTSNQPTVLFGSLREHSRKPDEFYNLVDEICIGRKLDYFSREEREGWDIYGNDTERFPRKT